VRNEIKNENGAEIKEEERMKSEHSREIRKSHIGK
jgi:hypothetical protein